MRRNFWSRQHTIGLITGILTIIVAVPVVALILYYFRGDTAIWRNLAFYHAVQAQVLSLASIPNLFWFHRFLKKEKWNLGYGVIYATIINFIVVMIIKYAL